MKSYQVQTVVTIIFLIIIRTSSASASSKAIKAKPALCMPEVQVVKVKENPNPARITYFPNCVRLKRCGGCCNHELLSCQPTATEIRNYEIQTVEMDGGTVVKNFKEVVPLEEHTACKCDCIIKAEDCTDKQFYDEWDQCRCSCANLDEKNECQHQHALKFWDETNCSCNCREIRNCSAGSVFDTNSCSCERQG